MIGPAGMPYISVQVPALVVLENAAVREAADVVSQPWFKLYQLLAAWRPDADMPAWALSAKGLAAHPQGFQRQLDAVAAMRPEHVTPGHWSMLVEERLRQATRSGYSWEELVSSWTALYCKICAYAAAAAAAPAVEAGSDVGPDVRLLPGLDEFLLQMFALEADPQAQLDLAADYRPAGMTQADWDTEVGKVSIYVGRPEASRACCQVNHATATCHNSCNQLQPKGHILYCGLYSPLSSGDR